MKKRLFSILLSLAMVITMMPAMTVASYADIPENAEVSIEKTGNETKYMTLSNFRDSVNSGETYSGCIVTLLKDINLNNTDWTPIGNTSDTGKIFEGCFDGGNHTISNLKISTENAFAGLFGYVGWQNTISVKNLTIDNASVCTTATTGAAHAGAVVGQNQQYITMDNVHVTGTVQVEVESQSTNTRDAAGIIGKTVGGAKITNCSVIASENSNSYIKAYNSGASAGGIMGFMASDCSNDIYFENCRVENLDVSAFHRVGGVVGTIQKNDNISNKKYVSNCSVKNVNVTATGGGAATDGMDGRHSAQAGLIVGCSAGSKNRNLNIYSNNTYAGDCSVTCVSTATDVIKTQLYGLWTLGYTRAKDLGQTWGNEGGDCIVTYANAEETGEVLIKGKYYKTFLSAYHAEGAGMTGSAEAEPFKLMTDVGYSLVVGDKIYVEGDGHIFYPRTDEEGYRVKTTAVNNTVKLYELETDPEAHFVASLTVGDTAKNFTTINKAFAAAPINGTPCTITVLEDCMMSTNYTIPTGCDITLELNGKTVEMVDIARLAMFYVQGTLTVQDNTDTLKNGTGTGKLWSHSDTVAMYGLATQNGTINFNSGLLLVESKSSTLTDQIQALYIGGNKNGIINANGGKVKATVANTANQSAYVFYGSGSSTEGAKFTLNGSVFEGDSGKSYIIGDNTPYGNTTLSLIQGTLISPNRSVDKYGDKSDGGSFVGCDIIDILHIDSVIDKPDDATRVIRINYAARIGTGENAEYYLTLGDAIAAVQDEETITMLRDVALTDEISIPDNKTFTMDLDNNTITTTAVTGFSNNGANLTVKNGTVKNTNTSGNFGKTMETRTKAFFLWKDGMGSLTLDGVKIESTGYSINSDNNNNSNGSKNKKIVIKDCEIKSGKWAAVYAGGADNSNELSIINSELHSSCETPNMAALQICMKATLENTTVTNEGGAALGCFENTDLLIKGTGNSFEAASGAISTNGSQDLVQITVEGGTF